MKSYRRLLGERIRKAVAEGGLSLEQASREGRQWLRRMKARERLKARKEEAEEEVPAKPKKRGRPKKVA
jgi:hypothetical protein